METAVSLESFSLRHIPEDKVLSSRKPGDVPSLDHGSAGHIKYHKDEIVFRTTLLNVVLHDPTDLPNDDREQ